MRKKRPALLLEVLIALSLIGLCIVPLIRQPIALHRFEMDQLHRVETSRIAAWTFSEIQEKLLKNEIRWSQIPSYKVTGSPISLPHAKLQLPFGPQKISRRYTFSTLEEKVEDNGKVHKLIAIHMTIGSDDYTYRLTVSKE